MSDAIYTIGTQAVKKAKIIVNMIAKDLPVVTTSLEIAAINTKLSRM